MKKKRRQRVIAVLMATLMIVGLIPTDFALTTAKAGTTTNTFDAATELATPLVAKSTAIANGTKYQNGYFTTFGIITTDPITSVQTTNTTKRGNSDTFSLEVGKALTSGLQFTTTGTSTVIIKAGSTSSANTSSVGLSNSTNVLMTEGSGKTTVTVTGTAAVEFSYSNLPAGTYQIISPSDANNRGFRIYSATVTETATVTGAKSAISNVTSSISGSTATINWVATGGSGAETTLVEYSNDAGTTWTAVGTVAQDAITTTQDMSALASGSYQFRVTGLAALAATSVDWTQPRKSWSTVTGPSVTAVQVGADIKATWTMNLGTDGADSLVVDLLDSSNAVVDTKTIAKTATTQASGDSVLAVSASGSYTVRVTAKRADETTDKIVTSAAVSYAAALTEPTVVSATGDGKGGVAFVWDAVNEANTYTVSYKKVGEADTAYVVAKAGIATTSYTVTGLTADTKL